MNFTRSLLLFLFALCSSSMAEGPAASASFEPASGSTGRPVEFRVNITSRLGVPGLPNMVPPAGLDLQPTGSMVRAISVNGENMQLTTFSYVTVPQKLGSFTVAAFAVEVDGQMVQVPPATLVVAAPAGGDRAYEPVRAVLDLPSREFYVGEAINARLIFISTPDEVPQYIQHIAKTSGGTVLFKPGKTMRSGPFKVAGKDVEGVAMAVEITPLVDGEGDLNCESIVQVQKLDPFGRRSGFATQSTIQSQTARLRVLPLPKAGRPKGFTGAIGEFTVSQPKLSNTDTEVGEPITLTFALSGEGNLDSVPPPEMAENPDWTAYRPTSELSRDDETGKVMKSFSYTLVPKRDGRRGTPPLPFAYFDPVKKKFEDITIPPIPFLVKAAVNATAIDPAAAAATTAAPAGLAEPEPALTGLAEKPGRWTRRLGPSFQWFLLAQVVPPALLLFFWALRRRSEYLAAHPEILQRRRARAAARRALSAARAAARRGDAPAFLKAGTGALCEAATQVGSAAATSLTPAEVLGSLEGEAAQAARAIFNHADAARYASATSELPKPATLLPGLENAVAQLTARA